MLNAREQRKSYLLHIAANHIDEFSSYERVSFDAKVGTGANLVDEIRSLLEDEKDDFENPNKRKRY